MALCTVKLYRFYKFSSFFFYLTKKCVLEVRGILLETISLERVKCEMKRSLLPPTRLYAVIRSVCLSEVL